LTVSGALMGLKSSVQTIVMANLQIVPFSYHFKTTVDVFKHTTQYNTRRKQRVKYFVS